MSDDFINQTIQAAVAKQQEAPAPTESVETKPETTTEEIKQADSEESSGVEPNEPTGEPFPKKAVNLIDKRNKQLARMRAELNAAENELYRYREAERAQKEKPLNEADFDGNYGEFLKQQAIREYEQQQAETRKQQESATASQQETAWIQERSQHLANKAQDAMAKIPEYSGLYQEYADVMAGMSHDIGRAFLEIDEPAMAFYALAKEGKLEDVLSMSPFKAAIEIGKAEARGIALAAVKPQTKAPAPITGMKGSGNTGKTINPNDYHALKAKLGLK